METTKLDFKTRRATHEDKKVLGFLGDPSQPKLQKGDTAFIAIDKSKGALGYIAGHQEDGVYIINQLYVPQCYRRNHVATNLIKHFLMYLRFHRYGGSIDPVEVVVRVPKCLDTLAVSRCLTKLGLDRLDIVNEPGYTIHEYVRIMEFGMLSEEGWMV